MSRLSFRPILLGMIAAPLALGLAACGDKTGSEGASTGDRIENIAPPAGTSWADMIEQTPEGGYRMGNPEAPIKLIEFASMTCPHCAHFTEEGGEELRNQFVASGRVSWEFRNFVMNPLDLTLAMAIRCGAPESFFALTEQALANQETFIETWTQAGEQRAMQAVNLPPEQRYNAIAELVGIDDFFAARGIAADQTKSCLAKGEAGEVLVKATQEQGEQHNITGTPSFLINGALADINTWADVKARLEAMGAR